MSFTERLTSVAVVCSALLAISTLARAQGRSDDREARPRIHVHYDYMGYSSGQDACSTDNQCTALGTGHAGERCTGPAVLPTAPHSCAFTCRTDSQCTARGGGHVGDRCIAERCQHTHDPQVIAPGAIEEVVDSFARQGIDLIIDPVHHSVPHSHVLAEFGRSLSDMTDFCEGGSIASGTAGLGKYAESFDDLKAAFFHPEDSDKHPEDPDKLVHYAVFGHYTTCDTPGHCNACPATGLIPAPAPFGSSGLAIIDGGFPQTSLPSNFMVTLGNVIQDRNVAPTIHNVGGTFMHELGHNLGLRHGGGSDIDGSGEDSPTFKPNFLSVMNYKFQLLGIQVADAIGSYIPSGTARLDYSGQVLPAGGNTPGSLTEGGPGLNEVAGLGSGTADLTSFDDGACKFGFQPTNGPLDFDGDGNKNGLHVSADLNRQDHPGVMACPSGVTETLTGHNDWELVKRLLALSSTPGAKQYTSALAYPESSSPELTGDMAEAHHALHPFRTVEIQIRPGCATERARIAPGQRGTVTVAVLGGATLEVNQIEPSSLTFAGAKQLYSFVSDVNQDGQPDLVAVFNMQHVRLHPSAGSARVAGWLKNSQAFVASGQVMVVPTLEGEVASCRQ